ncbi:hypothetical protein HanPSC8_Chr12g0539821 [Helianthus annuus]|nr:hypothetical protein HanPSC8_Chr12g0539821 [Helianthus annuus]
MHFHFHLILLKQIPGSLESIRPKPTSRFFLLLRSLNLLLLRRPKPTSVLLGACHEVRGGYDDFLGLVAYGGLRVPRHRLGACHEVTVG